jgi:3-oxoacyl-[acyl-carrier protein] reductase
MDLQLSGKTALVTGASRGIGRAIALGLAREGVKIAIAARRVNLLEELAREIASARGAEPLVIEADLYKENSAEKLASDTARGLGRIDILVNAAGPTPSKRPRNNGRRGSSSISSACASCRMRSSPA